MRSPVIASAKMNGVDRTSIIRSMLLIALLWSMSPHSWAEPPPNVGTPEETARLAKAASKYDIAGMRLGTPLKEAMTALRAHNQKLQMQKNAVRYDVLGGELLYGLTFMSPEERFVFGLTMPPNAIVVSKLSRMLVFTKDTAPTQQMIVQDLIRKYGQPSTDSGARQLNDANLRVLVWLDEADGSRMRDTGESCLANSSFSTGSGSQGVEPAQLQQMEVTMRLESRFIAGGHDPCQSRRMVQARLRRCCQNALAAADLVGALTITMGDGPLDAISTGATHQLLVKSVEARDDRERAGAQQNRPKL